MFEDAAVVGAAGKMGRGIALLIVQVFAFEKLGGPERCFRLRLIDENRGTLDRLPQFLRKHLRRYAEKQINSLRQQAANIPHLVSNAEVIEAFVKAGLDCLWMGSSVYQAESTEILFEAVDEDVEVKRGIFAAFDGISPLETVICTNTSAIPIHVLQSACHHPLIGFHFYNPPQIQRLVEFVIPEGLAKEYCDIPSKLATLFGKVAVKANDIAGFIGNGQFIRELNFACHLVEQLSQTHSCYQALYMVDRITREFLLRPMGMFQLVDYIGTPLCLKVSQVMTKYLERTQLVPKLLIQVSPKNFFTYEGTTPVAVYDVVEGCYRPFNEGQWVAECHRELGAAPEGCLPWKQLQRDPEQQQKVALYLKALFQASTMGALLCQNYLDETQNIALALVRDGVAEDIDSVSTVMREGFHHLYGPNLKVSV